MRVFHREHAGRPVRIAWTLEEIGAPYELTVMTREESRGDAHRARHPLGRVPVLETEGGYIFESAAICLHLADAHPEAELIAAVGTYERALVYQWACFAPAEMEPPLFEAWAQADRDADRSAAARKRFDGAAQAVAHALDGHDYLVGERFTVADVLVGTSLAFTARAGIGDEMPDTLKDYVRRLAERPAFQRAVARTMG